MDFARLSRIITAGFVIGVIPVLGLSLYWQITTPAEGDSGFLNYFAWLIVNHHYVPYRDLFDTSFPMALLFHIGATWIGSASETAFQLSNIALLLIVLWLGYRIVAQISQQAAIIAMTCFGIFYQWQDIALARDFQCLLWLLCAINILLTTRWSLERRVILASCFFALAVATKPHFIIGVLPLMWFVWQREALKLRDSLRLTGISMVSGIITASLPFIWLWSTGGWQAFIDITTGYLPLYMELSGNIHVVTAAERMTHLLTGWFNLCKYIVPLMALSLFVFFRQSRDRLATQLVILLTAEALIYTLYITAAGKFWLYQQTPFIFFAFTIIALAFDWPKNSRAGAAAGFLVMMVIAISSFSMIRDMIKKREKHYASENIVNYLAGQQTDLSTTAQLWQYNTDGARGLWLSGVQPATPHVTHEAFYHHVSDAYTRRLRREILVQLRNSEPDFIIREKYLFIPAGEDSTNRFEAFDQLIADEYQLDKEDDYYRFYRRKIPSGK